MEIDPIFREGDVLEFVDVKIRSSETLVRLASAVNLDSI